MKGNAMTEETKPRGIDTLRDAVKALNACSETFLDPFTPEQLLAICKVWKECEWDFYPDEWEPRQIREAIRGIVPRWNVPLNGDYKAIYDGVEVLPKGTRVRIADGYQWNVPMACLNGAVGTVLFNYRDPGCAGLLFCGPILVRWIDGTKIRQREFFFEDLEVVEDEP